MTKGKNAFTLAELLIALAITSILVVVLVSVVSGALNIWGQGRNQIDTFSNARQTLGRIADEIKGATASTQIQFVENVPALNAQSSPSPAPAPSPGTSENLFFVAPYPNSGNGDLCVIAYRHNRTNHTLERGFTDSQTAWNAAASARYQASAYSSNLNWRSVANGVLEFEVLSYSQKNLDDSSNPTATWDSLPAGDPNMTSNAPRRLILRLKVVDDKTLVRLNALQAAGSGLYNQVANQAAREFRQEVSLPSPH